MSHHVEVKNPGSHVIGSGLRGLFLFLIVIGIASFFAGLKVDHQRVWSTFVIDHFYFMSLALGGFFFLMITTLTGGTWAAPVKRLAEATTSYLPVSILTFGVLYFGMHHLYEWTHAETVAADPILSGKASYLNVPFFVIRQVLFMGLWIFFSKKIVGYSLKQDQNGDVEHTYAIRRIVPPAMIVFAISFTFASWDLIMSLDPHWFSTIYGIYCFAGAFYSSMALLCLMVLAFQKNGKLAGLVNDNHLHDIGKIMFAFTVFWAYIGFSQFMLIWYANMPEETGWYLLRMNSGWMPIALFLLLGKFVAVFMALLPRDAKRCKTILKYTAIFMLIAQWVDIMWLVQPHFFSTGPRFSWIELGVTLGFVGLFGLVVSRFLGAHPVVAFRDPGMQEALELNQ